MKYPAVLPRKTSGLFFFVLFSLCPFDAFAETPYFSLHGGLIFQDDYFVESEGQFNNFTSSETENTTEMGTRFGLAYGYFVDVMRFEAEFAHRNIDFDGGELSNGNGDTDLDSGGSVSSNSLMANLYASQPLGLSGTTVFSMVFGIGAGIAWLDVDDVDTSSAATSKDLSDSTEVGALQIMLGISTLDGKNELGMSLEYRLFVTEDADLEDSGGTKILADGFSSSEIVFSVQIPID